ncbi:PolC-type DNA polymerase III [Diplocloster modestus]|uniref:DNA polymerase III PolC-type n=1 Tax=Diplocloster modestus TaxID=2850322 RepID=A0ABS6K2U5_9FIRM|nr:PolC-type DNA polymerase III [Diplocloster modestus]MBU9724825.1 PolC-type DNA polymerase III [Diplocloster modestus]
MAKPFFEVFPTLELKEDLRDMMECTQISKVSTNPKRDAIRIHINSKILIQKDHIFRLERSIKDQLFPNVPMLIKIYEKYELSDQYTPRKLMEIYHNSILDELREYSMVEYNLFRKAKWEFVEEQIMVLHLEQTVVAASKTDELVRILEKIFHERCGFPVQVRVEFEEVKPSKYREQSDQKIRQEVANIASVIQGAKGPEKDPGVQEQQGHQGQQGRKGREDRQDTSFRRAPRGFKRSDNPDVLYGRDFEEDAMPIEQLVGEIGEVVLRGQIMTLDTREIRNEKTIIIFSITDFTDSINVKMFVKNDELSDILEGIKKGAFIKIKGVSNIDRFDGELSIASVVGIKSIADFRTGRMDVSPVKRVELHCHTKMSDMDGVSDVGDIIKQAVKWGHKAVAITDHGVVQSFPEANHAIPKDSDFKIIYGMEAYLVDDLKEIVTDSRNQSLDDTYVVFDLETTGFSPVNNRIIEIGAVKVVEGRITDRFSTFVNPDVPIPFDIEKLTGINDHMVLDAPMIDQVLPEFLAFCEGAVMVAHNAGFDMSFVLRNAKRMGISLHKTVVDTVSLARVLLPQLNRFKLDTVAKALNISLDNHHRAVDDAACTAEIFLKFVEMLKNRDVTTLDGVNSISTLDHTAIKKLPTYHAIILARNDVGRVNLYRLVSMSHIDYYAKRPRVPKSLFMKYREGLLIGSACEAGELYQALLRESPQEEIARLAQFYDYLEIQPLGNNEFMLRDEKSTVNSRQDLINLNKRIVELGEQFRKPVVATCDVHFLNPEDEVYRRIIMAGKGFKDADMQAPLFYRTTEEMLEEFSYLGSEKAEEVVITNTNKITNMIERISPVRPDKCPPVIEDSDKTLRNICYNTAHEMYGDELPQVVVERLERELNSIISNGFAVMYIIAQKLVWKSNEDGYLVGSRGSVGSSFVATMAGITEVNPLAPHYYCKKCHYSDFDSDLVKSFSGGSGCDMPDRNCPECGEPLVKAGFDIPFETFLGFKGNKEPDIDLNFSGDYQGNAHRYTEVIFGEGQTFRAGTIGTLADKTAFGYVKNYYEERGVRKRNCEITRIVDGCVGVRRTTGQHPGGIIVLPHGEEIYSFTPVQRPANDMTTDIITTHFDYHSIDHNLLKLDILGHDDPTMIRMLEDLTGLDAKTIPLDNKEVMSLFLNTEALGIKPEDIGGCKLGSLGIPEFGTEFVIQMLQDTKPKTFSDLVRISGLSHGTDVWLGNAQTLIEEGKATISTAICTRDDIMIYLIHMGMDSELSFTIMESVRKGKGLKPEWEEAMLKANVPDWYIWSCKKIKYMFPKAHAAAYVMMAFRIAYFKVFYPLAYYAAFFSIRASSFNYEIMCLGRDKLEYFLDDYKRRSDTLSKKEQDTLKDMKIVQEMYARGFDFMPIDIYRAQASKFQIIDGKLMPSFSSIDGLGDKAADAIVDAAKDGKFLSKDDFRTRTKVSKTVTDLMDDLHLMGDLPESNQLSLFDL